MSTTADYTATHQAFLSVAETHATQPFVIRILVALSEADENKLDVQALSRDLATHDSAIRRASAVLYARGWATGSAIDGGRRRQGKLTVLRPTERGMAIALAARLRSEAARD